MIEISTVKEIKSITKSITIRNVSEMIETIFEIMRIPKVKAVMANSIS
jgi:hypothetical protein